MLDCSIIVPVYTNTEQSLEWLGECLESVCLQDCEIITYDDKSPLDPREIIKMFPVHTFIKGSINSGVSHARNRAVYHATQRYVFPLDCDDTLSPHAIRKLLDTWTGTPIYPDVRKFGDETDDHYTLLDFDCSHIYNFVGFTSVNVLHSKEQWKFIGGWDETLDFYEDGEYNARLLGTFCGIRYPEPLVNYRMHPNQRTKTYNEKSRNYADKILAKVRSYNMACPGCSKRKGKSMIDQSQGRMMANTGRSEQTAPIAAGNAAVNLPLEFEGKVLCQYFGGKGAGKHYYRGINTKFPYHVTFGDYVYADPKDAAETAGQPSKLVKVKAPEQPKPEVIETVITAPEPPKPEPVPEPEPTPVVEEVIIKKKVEELPDVSTMNIKALLVLIDEADEETIEKILIMEEDGLNRKKVVERLKSKLGAT